jgi:hypothetical protein
MKYIAYAAMNVRATVIFRSYFRVFPRILNLAHPAATLPGGARKTWSTK